MKVTSGFIGQQILNFERSLSLSPGPKSSLVPPFFGIFLNKLKMVENTHQKYEKNQNKTSVAKRFTGPFLALRAPDRCSY
jgi:hypothetical protein